MARFAPALLAVSTAACAGARAEKAPPARVTVQDELQHAEIEEGRLAYELTGAGPALVLVNGGGMDFRQWDDVLPAFAQRFRVLRFDARGWGRSSAPTAPYSNVEDLAALLDGLGIEQAALLGCSFGGGLALDFTLAHQDRVRALVLAGPALGGFPWSEAFQRRNEVLAESVRRGRLGALFLDPSFVPGAQSDPRLRERVTRLIGENARLFSMDPSLARSLSPPAIERLGEIRVPTLVLAPEKDHPDVQAVVDVLAARVRGARKVVLAGAGHMAHMEKPAEFARAVLDFLARPEAAGGSSTPRTSRARARSATPSSPIPAPGGARPRDRAGVSSCSRRASTSPLSARRTASRCSRRPGSRASCSKQRRKTDHGGTEDAEERGGE